MEEKHIYDLAKSLYAEIKLAHPNYNIFFDDTYFDDFSNILLRKLQNVWTNVQRKELEAIKKMFSQIVREEKSNLEFPSALYDPVVGVLHKKYLTLGGIPDLCMFLALSLKLLMKEGNNVTNKNLLTFTYEHPSWSNGGEGDAIIRELYKKYSLHNLNYTITDDNEIRKILTSREIPHVNWSSSDNVLNYKLNQLFDFILLFNIPFHPCIDRSCTLCDDFGNEYEDVYQEVFEEDYTPFDEQVYLFNKYLKRNGFLYLVHEYNLFDDELLENIKTITERNGLYIDSVIRFNTLKSKYDINGKKYLQNNYGPYLMILKKSSIISEIKFYDINQGLSEKYIGQLIAATVNKPEFKNHLAFVPQITNFKINYKLSLDEMEKYNKNKFKRNIEDMPLRKLFTILEYNGINSRIPFGKNQEELDSNVIFVPRSYRLFEATGICFSEKELLNKIKHSNLHYRDLIGSDEVIKTIEPLAKALIRYKENEPDYYKEFLKLRLDDDWKEYLREEDDRFAYFDDPEYCGQKLDPLFWNLGKMKFDWLQFQDKGSFTGTSMAEFCEWLKKQIIYTNTVILRLNVDIIDGSYFKAFINSKSGLKLVKEWKDDCRYSDTLKALDNIMIEIPPLLEQQNIGNAYDEWKKVEAESKVGLGNVIDYIDCKVDTYLCPNQNNGYFDKLPQPLASLLYLEQCEISIKRKLESIFDFFEAVSIFHATVLMSWTYFLKPDYYVIPCLVTKRFHKQKLKDKFGKEFEATKIDFGLWNKIIDYIILPDLQPDTLESIKDPKEKSIADERKEICQILNKIFSSSNNIELLKVLYTAEHKRNELKAHTPRYSEKYCFSLYKEMVNYKNRLEELLILLYTNNIDFVYLEDVSIAYKESVFPFSMKGISPRLRLYDYKEKFDYNPDNKGKIYMITHTLGDTKEENPIRICPLLPFVTYGNLARMDNKLKTMFYLSEINWTGKMVGFVSYDAGDVPKCSIEDGREESLDKGEILIGTKKAYNEITNFINDNKDRWKNYKK